MKGLKLLSIIFLIIFITACKQTIVDNDKETKIAEELVISSLPTKTSYLYGQEFDDEGLEVYVIYCDSTSEVVDNYSLSSVSEEAIGEIKVTITWENLQTFFTITYEYPQKLGLKEYIDGEVFSKAKLYDDSLIKEIHNIVEGGWRRTNSLVRYTELNYLQANHYGYEIAINSLGIVVDVDVTVDLPEGGIVLSAHGTRIEDLKENVELNDIILWDTINKSIHIYRNDLIALTTGPYEYLTEAFKLLEFAEDNIRYNEIVEIINENIPIINDYFELLNNDEIEEALLLKELCMGYLDNIKFEEQIHSYNYSYTDLQYYDLKKPNQTNHYTLIDTYVGIEYGGFRLENSIVYYDQATYRLRNEFGYEFAVDANGLVVDSGILVDLPIGGAILSGHTQGQEYLQKTIRINDYIEYNHHQQAIEIFRDKYFTKGLELYHSIKTANSMIEIAYDSYKVLDYLYIESIQAILKAEYDQLIELYVLMEDNKISFLDRKQIFKLIDSIEQNLIIINFQLIEHHPIKTKGYWHYPFTSPYSLYDEKSKESVINYLDKVKTMGFNTIYLNLHSNGYLIYESDVFNTLPDLSAYDYGEYGNDYLKCFITEAHQRDLKVVAFTQTFMHHQNSIDGRYPDWYQMTYQGELAQGLVYYYDITNDNVQSVLIDWYKEMVAKYNFDAIEYDIIRYPVSYLPNYQDVEIIDNCSEIVDVGYTKYSINKFMEQYNLDGDLKELIATSKEIRSLWMQFKKDNLNHFVQQASFEMKTINPNIVLTAAVLKDYQIANKYYLQDWKYWLDNQWIDTLEIMNYTNDNDSLKQYIESNLDYFDKKNISIGISPMLYKGPIKMIAQQIDIIYQYPLNGFVLFSNRTFVHNDIITGFQSNNYHSISTWEENDLLINSYFDDLVKKIDNYYVFRDDNYDQIKETISKINNYDQFNQYKEELINNLYNIEKIVYHKIINELNQLQVFLD